MSKQIPPYPLPAPAASIMPGHVPGKVHLFDRFSPLSVIEGDLYYMCGEPYSLRTPYYQVDIAFEIVFEDTPLSDAGYEKCPGCWDREDIAFALLRQLP